MTELTEATDRLRESSGHEALGRVLAAPVFEDGVAILDDALREGLRVAEHVVARRQAALEAAGPTEREERERDLLEAREELAIAERGIEEILTLIDAARERWGWTHDD